MNKNRIPNSIILSLTGLVALYPISFVDALVKSLDLQKDMSKVLASGFSKLFFAIVSATLIGFGIYNVTKVFTENEIE